MWDAIQVESNFEVQFVSLFSRLRAVVSGDDYLDGDYDDELDYDGGELPEPTPPIRSSPLVLSSDFTADDPFAGTNVIGNQAIILLPRAAVLWAAAWRPRWRSENESARSP